MARNESLDPAALSALVKEKALALGFSFVGICHSVSEGDKEFYQWWADQGFAADMFYLRAQKKRRRSLQEILPGARSAVVCALRFPGSLENLSADETKEKGKVARYAMQDDYHGRLLPMLNELAQFLDEQAGILPEQKSLSYVDTGAISERALASEAGLGWIGKNAMLIHPEEGSWFWIGEVITSAELSADEATTDHCGKCRRCIDACPTGAILEDLRAVDSRKCIAYLNIEHRGPIAKQFHKPMGNWLLGCDICQEVCPWNEHSLRHARKEIGAPPAEWLDLEEILTMKPEDFTKRFKSRAISRAKLAGLQRNAIIVKKNLE